MIKELRVDQILNELAAIPAISAALPGWLKDWEALIDQPPADTYLTSRIISSATPDIVNKQAILEFAILGKKDSSIKSIRDIIELLDNAMIDTNCMKIANFDGFYVYNVSEWAVNWPAYSAKGRPVMTKQYTFRYSRAE